MPASFGRDMPTNTDSGLGSLPVFSRKVPTRLLFEVQNTGSRVESRTSLVGELGVSIWNEARSFLTLESTRRLTAESEKVALHSKY